MSSVSAVAAAGSVGAGVSQGRIQSTSQRAQATDRAVPAEDVRVAALELIQIAVTGSLSATTGRDLDVLA